MVDVSLQGVRCRAIQNIVGDQGTVRLSTEGTIQYELESLGRSLIKVHWDNGVCSLASPDDIEIVDTDVVWQ